MVQRYRGGFEVTRPKIAASVTKRVVGWGDAAEIKKLGDVSRCQQWLIQDGVPTPPMQSCERVSQEATGLLKPRN